MEDQALMFIIFGALAILIASVVEAYCAFARLARVDIKPGIMKSWFRWVMEAVWALLLVTGGVLLLMVEWLFAAIAVVGFWLVLPFIITPIMRNRLLPHWDEVKAELEPKGLTEKNYWREDWWMIPDKKKAKKEKKP